MGDRSAIATSPGVRATDDAGTCVGRLVRTERLRHLTFLWCWSPPALVQCVVPRTVATEFRTGSVIRVAGRWQPYLGHRPDCHDHELLADGVDVLAGPSGHTAEHTLAGVARSAALHARGMAVVTCQNHLDRAGFIRLPTPLVVGSDAADGPTHPFRLVRNGRHAFLPVSNLVSAHEAVAAGLHRVQLLSSLFWRHHSSDRSFLAEIGLVEFAQTQGGIDGVRTMAETLVESVRDKLRTTIGPLLPGNRLDQPLDGLPAITYAEVAELVRRSGVDLDGRHVLPRAADSVVCRALGSAGYWVTHPPADTTPYYVRSADGRSVALDLHLLGIGEVASGSEWVTDPAEARVATAGVPTAGSGSWYSAAVDRGLPVGTAGMSLGIDRLLMYLLGVCKAAGLVPEPRTSRSFRQAPPVGERPSVATEPARPGVSAAAAQKRSARVVTLSRVLLGQGFSQCVTSLLDEPWHMVLGGDPAEVDYFGRRAALVASRAPVHHRLLASCPAPVFEVGPTAGTGPAWTRPRSTLDIALLDPEPATLYVLAGELLSLLSGDRPPPVQRPMRPGGASYLRGSIDGVGLHGAEWVRGDQVVASAGRWICAESEIGGALGTVGPEVDLDPLRRFLRSAPPPAGGISIDLDRVSSDERG